MKSRLDLSMVPECIACGCCCFSRARDYLRVAGIDYERLGEDAADLTEFIESLAYMKMKDGHCAALVYDVGRNAYLCSIYERRPDVCRWLERGSGQCAAERHEKAERPLELRRRYEQGAGSTKVTSPTNQPSARGSGASR